MRLRATLPPIPIALAACSILLAANGFVVLSMMEPGVAGSSPLASAIDFSLSAPSASEPRVPGTTLIGEIIGEQIVARRFPSKDAPAVESFKDINPQGAPTVFRLLDEVTGAKGRSWYRALLPIRPNGTEGYLPARNLLVTTTDYRITVDRARFRLTLWKADERVFRVPVGIGTGDTPTPEGDFYLISLLQPPDPDTVYGTYAYGLSGYSDVITDWVGGGVIGLHGSSTDSVGRAISKGCIRMRNNDIEKLVPMLPLGTPIQIY